LASKPLFFGSLLFSLKVYIYYKVYIYSKIIPHKIEINLALRLCFMLFREIGHWFCYFNRRFATSKNLNFESLYNKPNQQKSNRLWWRH